MKNSSAHLLHLLLRTGGGVVSWMMVMIGLGRVQCLVGGRRRRQLGDRARFDVDHVAMIVARHETSPLIDLDHVVVVVAEDETGFLRGLVLMIPAPVIFAQAVPSRRGKRMGMGRRVATRFRRLDEFRVPRHRIRIVSADRAHSGEIFFSKISLRM